MNSESVVPETEAELVRRPDEASAAGIPTGALGSFQDV